VKGIFIVTGCAKSVPLGSHLKTFESAVNPAGAASEEAVIVMFTFEVSAPFGIVTVAPSTTIVSPSGPMLFVTVLGAAPDDEEDDDELVLASSDEHDKVEPADKRRDRSANPESVERMARD